MKKATESAFGKKVAFKTGIKKLNSMFILHARWRVRIFIIAVSVNFSKFVLILKSLL